MKTHQSKVDDSSRKENSDPSYFASNQSYRMPPHFLQHSLVQAKLKEAQNSSAEGLDKETKPELENFFNFKFDSIKIHDNPASHQASELIQAKAYTTGNHIFFGREANSMTPLQRKSLLAHEAVHAIQQKAFSPNVIQTKPFIGTPDSTQEKEADNFANAFVLSQKEGYRSTALRMRSNLRISTMMAPAIQRLPKTWGGEWFADTYAEFQSGTGRGVKIDLRFKPGKVVDAELIGLTQSVRTIHNKTPFYPNSDPFYTGRAIKSKDAITIDSVTKETDEGTRIDRLKDRNNPIYGTKSLNKGEGLEKSVSAGNSEQGWHYKNPAGKIMEKDAKLSDAPKIRSVDVSKNSSQTFETAALAIKGNQTGTYYGSVSWGWRTDDKANFSKLPLSVVSEGVPSSTFIKSAEVWNTSKSSSGAENVDLPVVDVKVTTKPVNQVLEAGQMGPPIQIPTGTRVQIITSWHPPLLNGEIKVVDGPFTGLSMWISAEDMATLSDERS